MSIGFTGRTKAFALQADKPIQVASRNLYRKGIYLASHDTLETWVALGASPAPEDFFKLQPFEPLVFDHMAVVGPVWARGAGRIVVIDSMDPIVPFNPADLFTGGKKGIWIDPHDASTMFSDVAGTIPAVEGDRVQCLINKADGTKFTTAASWTAPILRRRNYQNYLEFDGTNILERQGSLPEAAGKAVIGNYFAAGIVPKTPSVASTTWYPIIGTNAGSGPGWHLGLDARGPVTVPLGHRIHVNAGSMNNHKTNFPYNEPCVVGGSYQVDPNDNRISTKLYGDGKYIDGRVAGFYTVGGESQMAKTFLGSSYDWGGSPTAPVGRMFTGELHGLIVAIDVSQEDRHRIDMYLGADVGAPVNSES